MERTNDIAPTENRAQFVIAVFDDWDALQGILVGMEEHVPMLAGAVVHARKDIPPHASALRLLKEMTDLHFAQSPHHITCTMGQLAYELSSKLARGARSVAEALHSWLGSDQAGQLESHIEMGRLVLWVELRTTDDYSVLCGRLVQSSPHMVGLCKIRFES
jgi:hypothetical protein